MTSQGKAVCLGEKPQQKSHSTGYQLSGYHENMFPENHSSPR